MGLGYSLSLIPKTLLSSKRYGLKKTLLRAENNLKLRSVKSELGYPLAAEERQQQEAQSSLSTVQFSIIVPLYNTHSAHLREMIESVQAQTYPHWQLCLADASDNEHASVGHICEQYAQDDERIVYQHLDKNEGIALNSNAALELATGEYLALLDHDDVLHPAALYYVHQEIMSSAADLLYSDEAVFRTNPQRAHYFHLKPSFSPDLLRTNNYIAHLLVFSRALMDKAGRFQAGYDGSQDHDLVLRLSERAQRIVHISRVLYFWRAHKGSTARGVEAKPYVRQATMQAIRAQLERLNLKGEVEDAACLHTYRVSYKLSEQATSPAAVDVVWWDKQEELTPEKIVQQTATPYLMFLHKSLEPLGSEWMQELLMFAQREDVACVGGKLLYANGLVKQAGIALEEDAFFAAAIPGKSEGELRYPHRNFGRNAPGYASRLQVAQNVTAVSACCMMISREKFLAAGGFVQLPVEQASLQFCQELARKGLRVVYTPYAEFIENVQ